MILTAGWTSWWIRVPAALLALFACVCAGCAPARSAGGSVRILASDVPRFYAALDDVPDGATAEVVASRLQTRYFAGGSDALRDFVKARIGSPDRLARAYIERRRLYEEMRPTLLELAGDPRIEPSVREAFQKIEAWAPGSTFPDTHLLIGRMSSAGTVGPSGLLIGLEMFGRTPDLDLTGVDRWTAQTLRSPDDLVHTIVHEAVHVLQRSRSPRTLLAVAIHEGMCDYIASLATGRQRNTPTYLYARLNEGRLWEEFSARMHDSDWGDWVYATPGDPTRPPDLGYAIGYFICRAYHERVGDASRAVRDMLAMTDAEAFLEASGYAGRSSETPSSPR